MRTTAARICLAALLGCAPFSARAHDGPEHEIEELTARMTKDGETAELLTARAVEYRILGKLAEAAKDLDRAAKLDPDSVAIPRELGRVLFLGGKAGDALASVARGLTLKGGEPADFAGLRMLRAEILRSQNENKKALEDCDAALRLHKKNPEWYLLRSDIQRRLKAHKERLAGLDDGIRETGAGVLEIERVEAQIDAGLFAAALPVIERELADSRIRSSWLIRRARARLGLAKRADADRDLREALAEIGQRLNPKSPDAPLLLDMAVALELLGEKAEAIRAYETVRDIGAGDAAKEKIKSLKDAAPSSPPADTKP